MKIICSYCKKPNGEKEPLSDGRISHCMCEECYEYFERQMDGLSLDEYLDDFDSPILIVNGEGRVAASNKKASEMLGKTDRGTLGLLGGEAVECDFARLPEQCGNTVHCETCTIRNTVMHAMNTGESKIKEPVRLTRAGKQIEMTISTYFINGVVQIVIER